jgi:hypothetical protein
MTSKVIELVGTSPSSWQEAAASALASAAKTLRDVTWMEVIGWSAKIENQKIAEYRATIKLTFQVHEKVQSQL